MPSIQIIATPPGEEREPMRNAWVGLILPLIQGHPLGPVSCLAIRPLPPRSARLQGRPQNFLEQLYRIPGYWADGFKAVAILSRFNPTVAEAWRAHCPVKLEPGQAFRFSSEVCLLLDAAGKVLRPQPLDPNFDPTALSRTEERWSEF